MPTYITHSREETVALGKRAAAVLPAAAVRACGAGGTYPPCRRIGHFIKDSGTPVGGDSVKALSAARWAGGADPIGILSGICGSGGNYSAPSPLSTAGMVRNRILMSVQRLRSRIYLRSSSTHSSKLMLLRPLHCQ